MFDSTLALPNIRKLIRADEGFTLFEVDLQGADARVVAWEADDPLLKIAFRQGVDIHALNARELWPDPRPLSAYKSDMDLAIRRQKAKTGVHAVNYGCKARTLATSLSISTSEAETFIQKWFNSHPNIRMWHNRILDRLRRNRRVGNNWGYHIDLFDRIEDLLPEALAWIGQSTTAIAINRLIVQLDAYFGPQIEILLQTHDSVTLQTPTRGLQSFIPELKFQCGKLVVPYPDPMPMPCDIQMSNVSWGDVKPLKVEAF